MSKRHFLSLLVVAASAAGAQVTSSVQTISLAAMKGQSVTLSAPSPGAQSVTLVDGAQNPFASDFTSTVNWSVSNSSGTTVKLVAYFANPAQALASGSGYIASSTCRSSRGLGERTPSKPARSFRDRRAILSFPGAT